MSRVNVFGSLNADLVTRIDAFPAAGETRRASGFAIHAGGKGANQAVAAGKLGADVAMFGALGDDALAPHLRTSLAAAGVDAGNVEVRTDAPTGTASIWVDARGENAIAIAAGANGKLDADWVDARFDGLRSCDLLLLQGEIPIDAMTHLLRRLPSRAPRVILDPAPVVPLEDAANDRIWLLTPNEHELRELAGGIATGDDRGVRSACDAVRDRFGIARVLCKAGERGAYLSTQDGFVHFPGFRVDVVDTTAAGDAFNGGLATALAAGRSLPGAVRYAHAVAALAVTKEGAQPAMPDREAVRDFLAERGEPADAGG